MRNMRWIGPWICVAALAIGCSDYGSDAKGTYQAPILSADASGVLELRGGIDFGQAVSDSFSKDKVLTGYVFDANQGARVTLSLTSANGEDPVLVLYGPLSRRGAWGEHIALDDDGKDGHNALINDFALPATGRYLAGLASFDGSAGGPFELLLGCRGACDEPHCPDVMCDLYCPGGFMTNPDGCPVCRCAGVECQADADCPVYDWTTAQPRCIDGACIYEQVECDSDDDCPEGTVCVQGCGCWVDESGEEHCDCFGECLPGTDPVCETDEDCLMPDGQAGRCVDGRCVPPALECESDADCPDGQVCEMACWDCDPAMPDCVPGCEGHCVPAPPPQCETDADCPAGFACLVECWAPGCDPSTGECPPECDPATGQCDEYCQGYCVPRQEPECVTDDDCIYPDGQTGQCIEGRCVFDEIPCDDSMPCPPGMECVMVCWDCDPSDPDCEPGCQGFCVPVEPQCYADTDCIGPDGQTGRCVDGHCVFDPLYCHADWECPPGFYCAMARCGPDCDPSTDPACCVGVCMPDEPPMCEVDEDCIIAGPDGTTSIGRCIDGRCVYDDCACPEIYDPVCAEICYQTPECAPGEPCTEVCERRTYDNACFAECEGAVILHPGTCDQPPPGCRSNADCPPGMYCEFCPEGPGGPCSDEGVCQLLPEMNCEVDSDCPEGYRCELQACPGCDPDDESCPPCWGQCVPAESQCIVTGCSGEICAPYPVESTCVWLPEYACLALTSCELLTSANGQQTCGWVQNDAYLACLEDIYNADECSSDADCPPGMGCVTYCDETGQCRSACQPMDCVCPEYADPVCGVDGQTYDNICFLNCAGVEMLHPGPC